MQHPVKDWENGEIILVDKPLGWTSFDVVNKLRFALQVKKIGHAGTLDPLATGLLIICTGKKTKEIETYQNAIKTYCGTIRFGCTTPSYDAETQPDAYFETAHLNLETIRKAASEMVGKLAQYPPIFSAIKKNGKRLYEHARKGIPVQPEARQVEIFRFDILDFQDNAARFEVVCSKGTYIRSLAHDLGKKLGSGAYLSQLRRTAIGTFRIEEAYCLSDFLEKFEIKRPTPLRKTAKY